MGLNELVQTWFPVLATCGGIAATVALYFLNSRIDKQVDAARDEINKRTDDALKAAKDEMGASIKKVERETDKVLAAQAINHDKLRTQVIDHDRRVITLENVTKVLPTKEDVHQVQLAVKVGMEKLGGEIGKLGVRQEDLSRSSNANGAKLDRLEQHIYTREGEKA